MSLLTGTQILEEIEQKRIVIDPFVKEHIGPNSVDLRLGPTLLVFDKRYNSEPLDMKKDPKEWYQIERMTENEGYLLQPGILYLGHTLEYTETPFHVPCIDGRSSVGRLGMKVHITAGFGDIGFKGDWTLELEVVRPLIIYPYTRVCQISYHTVEGFVRPYEGNYQNQRGPKVSGLYKSFGKK